jgi:predicted HicB family RNase H-like nuclease
LNSAPRTRFYGKIVGIRDLVTFEGTSVAKINASFKDAVDDYIETCRKSARDPEKAFKGSFNVRVKPNIHRLVSMKAQTLRISLNQYVESVLEEAVASDYSALEIEVPGSVRESLPEKIAHRSPQKRAGARRKK